MKQVLIVATIALAASFSVLAQKKPPQPKTQEELKALQAMLQATDPDTQIKAAENVVENFADSDFKSIALEIIAANYERKGDFSKAVVFGERTLEADPSNFDAMLVLAREYTKNTHDTDFDKEDKLKKAEKYTNDAIAAINAASKPNPKLTDDQWVEAKKDYTADAHSVLGQIALVRKNPDLAVKEFKIAVDGAANPDPATYVRLAQADNLTGNYDDAIAAAEKAMKAPSAAPAVKQFAQAEKVRAVQKKGGANPGANAPAATPPAGTPPQQ